MSKKYELIYNQLRSDILSGVYQDGERLQSEPQMMVHHDVSRQTIRRVLSMLEQEGLIRKSHGRGSYVQYKEKKVSTKEIAVLFFDIDVSIFPILMQRIDEILYRNGYTASFYSTGGDPIKERAILQKLISTPVDGIIMHVGVPNPICINLDLVNELLAIGTKILFFDSWYANVEFSDFPVISAENYAGPYKITEHLIKTSHKRIGGFFLDSSLNMISRFSGICNALVRNGCEFSPENFFKIEHIAPLANVKAAISIDVLQSLDAFICPSGPLLAPVAELLQLHGKGKLRTIVVFDEVHLPQIEGIEYIVLKYVSTEAADLCAKSIMALADGQSVTSIQIPWELSATSTAKLLPTAYFAKPNMD